MTLSTVLMACGAMAGAPVGAPAGTTAMCNDGSFSSAANKQGACSSHKGVKEWYGAGDREGLGQQGHADLPLSGGPVVRQDRRTAPICRRSDAKAQGYHADHGKACQ